MNIFGRIWAWLLHVDMVVEKTFEAEFADITHGFTSMVERLDKAVSSEWTKVSYHQAQIDAATANKLKASINAQTAQGVRDRVAAIVGSPDTPSA